MPEQDRHFSPAEVSRRLGVSPKALRLYEARGLVTAVRTSNGWRAYGRAEIARLHQVLALKALRLPFPPKGYSPETKAKVTALLPKVALKFD